MAASVGVRQASHGDSMAQHSDFRRYWARKSSRRGGKGGHQKWATASPQRDDGSNSASARLRSRREAWAHVRFRIRKRRCPRSADGPACTRHERVRRTLRRHAPPRATRSRPRPWRAAPPQRRRGVRAVLNEARPHQALGPEQPVRRPPPSLAGCSTIARSLPCSPLVIGTPQAVVPAVDAASEAEAAVCWRRMQDQASRDIIGGRPFLVAGKDGIYVFGLQLGLIDATRQLRRLATFGGPSGDKGFEWWYGAYDAKTDSLLALAGERLYRIRAHGSAFEQIGSLSLPKSFLSDSGLLSSPGAIPFHVHDSKAYLALRSTLFAFDGKASRKSKTVPGRMMAWGAVDGSTLIGSLHPQRECLLVEASVPTERAHSQGPFLLRTRKRRAPPSWGKESVARGPAISWAPRYAFRPIEKGQPALA